MDLKLLATLKDKLIHAKDLSEILTYFFDHFGDHPAFIALGERAEEPLLEAVIKEVGGQLFPGKKIRLDNFLLTRLPEHHFIHGGFILNGNVGNVIYFEDIHAGLLALIAFSKPSETKMARFTGRPVPNSYHRSRN